LPFAFSLPVIRAVIFDFDGVIANSEPLHFVAFRDVLAQEGIAFSEAQYYASYLGYDDVGVFRAVADNGRVKWSAEAIAALVERKAARLEAIERDQSTLFPGAVAAIERLAAVFPLAIASGALKAEILRVLDRARLTRHFRAIVAAEDTPRSKPAPDPYLRAVSLLSAAIGQPLAGAECVAIEDSHWGLESARAADLRTIGITHTYPASALAAADLVIANLDALTPTTVRTFKHD
jgi:beta-phosphoglucomutase